MQGEDGGVVFLAEHVGRRAERLARERDEALDRIEELAGEAYGAERLVDTTRRLVEEARAEVAAAALRLDEEIAEREAERAEWDRLVRGLAQANAALRGRLRAVSWAEAGRGRFLALVGAAWLLWLRVREARPVAVGRPTRRERERWAGGIALTYFALVVVAARLLGL